MRIFQNAERPTVPTNSKPSWEILLRLWMFWISSTFGQAASPHSWMPAQRKQGELCEHEYACVEHRPYGYGYMNVLCTSSPYLCPAMRAYMHTARFTKPPSPQLDHFFGFRFPNKTPKPAIRKQRQLRSLNHRLGNSKVQSYPNFHLRITTCDKAWPSLETARSCPCGGMARHP